MEGSRAPTPKDYVAGAVLANSLAWLALGVAAFFAVDPATLAPLLFSAYIGGTILAVYLVTRKASQNHVKVGVKAGLGAFILHIYVFVGLIELIAGTSVLHMFDHLLILAIFISGGFVGAFLCKQVSRGKVQIT